MVYFLSRPLREYQLSRSKYYMTNKANIALTALSLAVSFPVFAEYSVSTKVGAEVWAADTKVNEARRDSSTTGTFYAAIEHDVKYVLMRAFVTQVLMRITWGSISSI